MSIYCWVIRHPEGVIVVDTGENARVGTEGYFACDPVSGWVNQRILRFDLEPALEIGPQLQRLGIQPADVRWVVLTHLHLDHVDGLQYFPKSDVLISRTEWERPFGVVKCLLPTWLKPRFIQHESGSELPLGKAYPLTKAEDVWLISTPGHSYGHQSVLVQTPKGDFFLAGDTTFDQQQLLTDQVAGICVDKAAARQTLQRIQDYGHRRPLVYLPSHDPESGERLTNKVVLYP